MNYFIPILAILIFGVFGYSSAYAHTTVHVEQYEIEVGWDVEPPVVGFRNAIVYEISTSPSEGVKNGVISAFKNLQSTIRMGGVTKGLDINSDPRPGHYFSKIIPTKTGSLLIELKGEINGVLVDIEIPIEDVETTAVLDFPPTYQNFCEDVVSTGFIQNCYCDLGDLALSGGVQIPEEGEIIGSRPSDFPSQFPEGEANPPGWRFIVVPAGIDVSPKVSCADIAEPLHGIDPPA